MFFEIGAYWTDATRSKIDRAALSLTLGVLGETADFEAPSGVKETNAMANTWITDLTHFLSENGAIAPMPGPARRLAEFLGRLVVDASTDYLDRPSNTAVKCRRRPGRKACPGTIATDLDPDTDDILWGCPACGDNGVIRNWKGSLWDCTRASKSH